MKCTTNIGQVMLGKRKVATKNVKIPQFITTWFWNHYYSNLTILFNFYLG